VIEPRKEVTVIVSRKDWRALLRGESLLILRIYEKRELVREFGENPGKYIVRVRITSATS